MTRDEVIEECARICDGIAAFHFETVRRRTPENGCTAAEMCAGARECAARIRELRTPHPTNNDSAKGE